MTKVEDIPEGDHTLDDVCREIVDLVWPAPDISEILSTQPLQEPPEENDHIREYALSVLTQVLMDQLQRDAVRHNNGPLIIALWKADMVRFYRKRHWKYLRAGHDLIAGDCKSVKTS